jgi:hypothetical protein
LQLTTHARWLTHAAMGVVKSRKTCVKKA